MIRVFLLDDHEVVRRGLADLLQAEGDLEVVDAVRRVAAGQSLLDPAVTAQVLERIRSGIEEPKELKGLTDQERRILEYIAEGLTNHEIAQRMFLADKTVKNYVSSVLAKLGLERRTQAAVLATRLLGGSRPTRG